jgi:GNAT superfamily N-acetyltransferase
VSSPYAIELARARDVAALPAIERLAAVLFGGLGAASAVPSETTPLEKLAAAQAAGRIWVARTPQGEPIGFALVEIVDGEPHLGEMDVLPAHGRRGVGRALLEAVCDQAVEGGHRSVTLTTFRDVAWNAPFYARAGFRALADGELGPGLRAILRDEAARGLDPARRVAMRRDLAASAAEGRREGRA